ncbi:Acyl-CoA-binding domain-containing protein 3 [Vitis vinifera]|uniref:Acyl-CoA-binding domain-containing protein 3 n=1 Tax=Vitis vinifera TaxID=29760 RepID=A0A438FBW7_VITVI|nr:Acyl-CoA-binding domain-containing protein 3 [Vitis vinifera]
MLLLWSIRLLSFIGLCSLSTYISKAMELFSRAFPNRCDFGYLFLCSIKDPFIGGRWWCSGRCPFGSCKDGESERGGRFVGVGSGLEICEGESVLAKLEVQEVLNDVDVDVGLEERLMEGGSGEKTVEVGGIVADLVEECAEDGGLEKREAVEDDAAVGLEKRLMEGGYGEKTVEVGEIAADLVEECVEDEVRSEKREAVEDDVAIGLEKRLMKEGCGEKTVEACDGVGGFEADLVEEFAEDEWNSEKREAVEEDAVVGLEEKLMKGDCGEETVEVSDGVSGVEADLVDDEGCSEKIEAVVGLEETLTKGDCGEETVEVCDRVNEVEAKLVDECVDDEGNSEKSEAVGLDCEGQNEVGDERGEFFDDDWEGIQRSELDRAFGAAAAFVGSEKNANHILNLNSDVKMHLYGLHKVAIEGPCREPPPMALKISARAKWRARFYQIFELPLFQSGYADYGSVWLLRMLKTKMDSVVKDKNRTEKSGGLKARAKA